MPRPRCEWRRGRVTQAAALGELITAVESNGVRSGADRGLFLACHAEALVVAASGHEALEPRRRAWLEHAPAAAGLPTRRAADPAGFANRRVLPVRAAFDAPRARRALPASTRRRPLWQTSAEHRDRVAGRGRILATVDVRVTALRAVASGVERNAIGFRARGFELTLDRCVPRGRSGANALVGPSASGGCYEPPQDLRAHPLATDLLPLESSSTRTAVASEARLVG